jgi:gamma-tubulin complex component 3
VSEPFFTTLHKWLFSGELYDPFSEFFVASDSATGTQFLHPSALTGNVEFLAGDGGFGGMDDTAEIRVGGLQLWQTKYRFQREMLPKFVGEVFGKKVWSRW